MWQDLYYICINSVNHHNIQWGWCYFLFLFFLPTWQWGKGGTEKLSNLPWSHSCWTSEMRFESRWWGTIYFHLQGPFLPGSLPVDLQVSSSLAIFYYVCYPLRVYAMGEQGPCPFPAGFSASPSPLPCMWQVLKTYLLNEGCNHKTTLVLNLSAR